MSEFPSRQLLIAAAICAIGSVATAQQPVFVDVSAIPLSPSTAKKIAVGEPGPGEAAIRPSPIVMETSGHIEADGSVSTTCAAHSTSTPHAVGASRPIIDKLQVR